MNRDHPTVSNASFYSTLSHRNLPKLILRTFDGSILQWQTFWDSFESSVHNNTNLSDAQKFSNLKYQLEGSAAMTVEGFSLTHGNYSRAIDLLRERYGQHHKIIHATMQALLQLPSASINIPSLRSFYDKMESYVRGLESLNQNQETYGSLLVPILLDKLPNELRKNLARENEHNNWNLINLRRAIDREINILEAGNSSTNLMEQTAMFHTQSKDRFTRNSNETEKSVVKCAYYNKNHYSNERKEFGNLDLRMKQVKRNKLCFNCLGKHQVAVCLSKKACRFCDRKHQSSICSKNP